jgi:hypothetical protein
MLSQTVPPDDDSRNEERDEPDDTPDTPPTEPEPIPVRDPRPEQTPPGPYIM